MDFSLCFVWYSIMNGNGLLDEFLSQKATCANLRQIVYSAAKNLFLKPGEMREY